jgi:hypothetical protein
VFGDFCGGVGWGGVHTTSLPLILQIFKKVFKILFQNISGPSRTFKFLKLFLNFR